MPASRTRRSTRSASRRARPRSTRRWRSGLSERPAAALLFDFGGTLDADGLKWKERFFALWRAGGAAERAQVFDPVIYSADDALGGTSPDKLSLYVSEMLLSCY